MKSISLIHTSWLKPFASFLAGHQICLKAYYDEANIDIKSVEHADGWITKQQLYRFLNSIASGINMPELGFVVGETLTPNSIGTIGVALAKTKTLGDAIGVFCRLINQSAEGNKAWVTEDEKKGGLWLFNRTTGTTSEDRSIADHGGLMTLVNLIRLKAGRDWYPSHVTLQTGPTDAYQKVAGLINTEIQFDSSATGVAFPAHWLLQPIHSNLADSTTETKNASLLDLKEPMPEKLKRLIQSMMGIGGMAPTAMLMANLCDMSPRSIHRNLKEAKTSYREIIDSVRLERAKERLTHSEITMNELAYELGYSGANNFIRAFRRMEGVTPQIFRNKIS
jgi:AraC-like DNA-binding protein